MRSDALGLFWEDVNAKLTKKKDLLYEQDWTELAPGRWIRAYLMELNPEDDNLQKTLSVDEAYLEAKASKQNIKAEPPDPVWLADDYLPGLEEALAFDIELYTDEQLVEDGLSWHTHPEGRKHILIFDVESYINYFLVAFKSLTNKKVVYFEISETAVEMDLRKLAWVFESFCVVGFNSKNYDLPICSLALAGYGYETLKKFTNNIIVNEEKYWHLLRSAKVKLIECNHIDLFDVAPLRASLKLYGGRIHVRKMQDLPFPSEINLSFNQVAITRLYCINDLDNTAELYNKLSKDLALRETLSLENGIDLRSKSDAQIAEAIIGKEVESLNGYKAYPPKIIPGQTFYYKVPEFIEYESELMKYVINQIANTPLVVSEIGRVDLPKSLKDLPVKINESTYRMGIGGLHSSEKSVSHYKTKDHILVDRDVASYYPRIILNQALYPSHLGTNFLQVYNTIVERRLEAKAAGNKTVADTLKITINGTFGKLGSRWSILYSPDLLIQVTLTGQLALLMLIERMELAGIPVVSANTDGIIMKCPTGKIDEMESIVTDWEYDTNFETEATYYKSVHSRDVNNYIAIVDEPEENEDKAKLKGVFSDPGLKKNPQTNVCIDAVNNYLIDRKPITTTIKECQELWKFVSVRTVNGGAVKLYEKDEPGLYLGKAIRWYYALNQVGPIVYAKSGNKVPKSDGAKPVMEMPDELPDDIDYDWYIREAYDILSKIDVVA